MLNLIGQELINYTGTRYWSGSDLAFYIYNELDNNDFNVNVVYSISNDYKCPRDGSKRGVIIINFYTVDNEFLTVDFITFDKEENYHV